MAKNPTLLYDNEVELVVASVVQHCVAREVDRPLVQQQLCEIFLRDLSLDDACFNELIDKDELQALHDATKIALQRTYKGFKKSMRSLETTDDLSVREVAGKSPSPKRELTFRSQERPDRKRVTCSDCDKQFATPKHLLRHRLIHTGERPYSCDECPEKFYRKDMLRAHQMRHGKVPKRFKCDACNAAYYRKDKLERHTLSHTGAKPYKCDSCAKRFARKDQLLIHQKLHLGKLLECSECGKGFRTEKHLARHMQLHTGLKPHKCRICNKQFALKYYLYSHLKTHSAKPKNALDESA